MDPVASLLDRIRGCRLCAEHLPHGPRPVLRLDPRARLLIASQAPGRKVHDTGIPFNDVSGDRLRAWLGMSRDEFYDESRVAIVPMGFCYPGTGRSGDLPPRPECAVAWRAEALAHLNALELTLVVGRYAQAYHLPASTGTLAEAAKAWQASWPHTVLLPHPSPRNTLWLKRNPWFEAELLPILRTRVRDLLGGTPGSGVR